MWSLEGEGLDVAREHGLEYVAGFKASDADGQLRVVVRDDAFGRLWMAWRVLMRAASRDCLASSEACSVSIVSPGAEPGAAGPRGASSAPRCADTARSVRELLVEPNV